MNWCQLVGVKWWNVGSWLYSVLLNNNTTFGFSLTNLLILSYSTLAWVSNAEPVFYRLPFLNDCGRVRLWTQIRRNFRIRGLTADGFLWERCRRGLMRIAISQHEMDVTHEPCAAWRVSWPPVSNYSTTALTPTSTCRAMQGHGVHLYRTPWRGAGGLIGRVICTLQEGTSSSSSSSTQRAPGSCTLPHSGGQEVRESLERWTVTCRQTDIQTCS